MACLIKRFNLCALFQEMLTELMFSGVHSATSTHLALQLVHKFEQLSIEGFPVEDVYPAVMEQYSEDILAVADIYEKSKKKPDVVRGSPPIAGTTFVGFLAIVIILSEKLYQINY